MTVGFKKRTVTCVCFFVFFLLNFFLFFRTSENDGPRGVFIKEMTTPARPPLVRF